MKAIVLVSFRAKNDHKVTYVPGEVKEFDNDRAVALAARGLVKPLEEAPIYNGDESAAPTPVKIGGPKASGKGKGKSSKNKETSVDTEYPKTKNEDASNPDNGQAADEYAESKSETESETETESKDNE